MSQSIEGMVPFITEDEIKEMVRELAREIERDYQGKEVVMICPLKGSIPFFADLCRELKLTQVLDFVHVTSPKGESCRILRDVSVNIRDKHVLIVEEIVDAGRTLNFLKARIRASSPASVKVVALLDKPARREIPLRPEYIGRTIEDRFVIGYGMDSEEIGRNYKDIFNFTQ
ncbi:MAG: hypoxanthine phosphoribosyltransferase [Bdellovibrionaceae bacterium]|nr:hypoxanthine phosphoribosyltransferase [Pseudobdellovibrionaceae bacterium]|tara:strand:+ start:462 stop:977 length:516 start_codon:yes stop_codon:yes gene_type:complete